MPVGELGEAAEDRGAALACTRGDQVVRSEVEHRALRGLRDGAAGCRRRLDLVDGAETVAVEQVDPDAQRAERADDGLDHRTHDLLPGGRPGETGGDLLEQEQAVGGELGGAAGACSAAYSGRSRPRRPPGWRRGGRRPRCAGRTPRPRVWPKSRTRSPRPSGRPRAWRGSCAAAGGRAAGAPRAGRPRRRRCARSPAPEKVGANSSVIRGSGRWLKASAGAPESTNRSKTSCSPSTEL